MKKIMFRLEELMQSGGVKKDAAILAGGGVALALSLINKYHHFLPLPFDIAWVAVIICGVPIILEAIAGLVTRFDVKADVLVSIALVASVCIHEDFAAGEIAFIMQVGSFLEDLTVARARAGIEKLVLLTPQTARVWKDGKEEIVPAENVRVGDTLRVLPGETVPVDGVILSGQTSINQAVITGEPLPVDKSAGDDIFSGTVNQFGAFEMRAYRVCEDSSVQRMIRLVRSADAGKAIIVGLADRWATWIVAIALSAAALTWFFTGEIIRAVTILVVFCPCALVLATPTAIMAAIGNAAKHGFLVREGGALERMAKVNKITFDKTGTLTCGTPVVTAVRSVSAFSDEDIYRMAAAVEMLSEHPLGKAVVKCFGRKVLPVSDFRMDPGEGVSGVADKKRIYAGNEKLLRKIGISVTEAVNADRYVEQGSTVIYVAVDNNLAGYIVLSDTLREDAAEMIEKTKTLGTTPVLLTGDRGNTASFIANKLGIGSVTADCLPEDKLAAIRAMQADGDSVCMIGDGINDAPALKRADVGIAMGGSGSDIAVDAADIALVDDKIKELPHLLALSRRMMTTIRTNLAFSMALNILAVFLAMTGTLGPVVGALVHNAGSVLVIINSVFLLKWGKKNSGPAIHAA